MAVVKPLAGNQFYLLIGDGGGSEVFTFLCPVDTISSKHTNDSESAYVADCADPTVLPVEVITAKYRSWMVTLSGLCDPTKAPYVRLKSVSRSASPFISMQLNKALSGANGGEIEQASFYIQDFTEDKAAHGLVKFSASLKSNGAVTITPNA